MNRFTLEPYSGMKSRYTCPECHRHKTFSRYIDMQTGDHIADNVGRCSREVNCAYHFTPAQYFASKSIADRPWTIARNATNIFDHRPSTMDYGQSNTYRSLSYKDFEPSYLPAGLLRLTVKNYENNNLVQYLATKFGEEVAYTQAILYLLGTSEHWPGATIFWQVDGAARVRTGKIMLYNAETGKRVKEPYSHITWAHSSSLKSLVGSQESALTQDLRLSTQDFNLKQCLFGEHLLQYEPQKPVVICESEKTAIIGAVRYPDMIWLAAGSLIGLNPGKCKCLEGRKVILVPDVNAYEQWVKKAAQLSAALPAVNFIVMRLLENEATAQQRDEGWDVADYL